MHVGISGQEAPPLRDVRWIGADGKESGELSLKELGDGYRILFFYQHACPGCHSHGFPTFARIVERLSGSGVGFAAIQTAFEDFEDNSFERIFEDQEHYGLHIPFGHAGPERGTSLPRIMADYQTGGTPWFVGIGPDDKVLFNAFQVDGDALVEALRPLLEASE